MDTEYRTLKFIGSGSKVIGQLVIVAGLMGFVYLLAVPFLTNNAHNTSAMWLPLVSAIGAFVSGLVTGGAFIAVGEIFHLFINMADDTERAADAIEDSMEAKTSADKP